MKFPEAGGGETKKGIVCKHCKAKFSVKETDAYLSSACKCGFAIIYKQDNLCGVYRFIAAEDFSLEKYFTTGKRKKDREEREQRFSDRFKL